MYVNNTVTDNQKLQKQVKSLRRKNIVLGNYNKFLGIALGVALFAIVGLSLYTITSTAILKSEIVELKTTNQNLIEENKELSAQYNEVAELLASVSEMSVDLDKSNKILKTENRVMHERIEEYEKREELHDKYDYAIERKDGSRTDFSYSELKTLEELTEEKGLSKETNDLILSIAMTESNGKEDAVNAESTATGYGQFLSSTGKFVYTKLMGNDTYSHELAKNGEINISMMVEYVAYLDDKYNGNVNNVMIEYRGVYDPAYLNKIDKFLEEKNTSLDTITIR